MYAAATKQEGLIKKLLKYLPTDALAAFQILNMRDGQGQTAYQIFALPELQPIDPNMSLASNPINRMDDEEEAYLEIEPFSGSSLGLGGSDNSTAANGFAMAQSYSAASLKGSQSGSSYSNLSLDVRSEASSDDDSSDPMDTRSDNSSGVSKSSPSIPKYVDFESSIKNKNNDDFLKLCQAAIPSGRAVFLVLDGSEQKTTRLIRERFGSAPIFSPQRDPQDYAKMDKNLAAVIPGELSNFLTLPYAPKTNCVYFDFMGSPEGNNSSDSYRF